MSPQNRGIRKVPDGASSPSRACSRQSSGKPLAFLAGLGSFFEFFAVGVVVSVVFTWNSGRADVRSMVLT